MFQQQQHISLLLFVSSVFISAFMFIYFTLPSDCFYSYYYSFFILFLFFGDIKQMKPGSAEAIKGTLR